MHCIQLQSGVLDESEHLLLLLLCGVQASKSVLLVIICLLLINKKTTLGNVACVGDGSQRMLQ
jgi:hypothetical protein